jgi:hypothetical protein
MPSRKIEDLTPECAVKFHQFSMAMHEEGIQFIVTNTRRTLEEQKAYYAQGRERIEEVNRLRGIAGLPAIGYQENKIITKTMKSKHLMGNAFDIAIVIDGEIIWNVNLDYDGDGVAEYKEAALIGESVGLRAGLRFGDAPHYEI